MRSIIITAYLFLSWAGNAQTRLDSIFFSALNEYRVKKNLQPLTWDTCIYREAVDEYHYLDTSTKDGNFREWVTGLCADYRIIRIDYNGDDDTSAVRELSGIFLDEIVKDKGEKGLLLKPILHGACYIAIRTIFEQNPDRQSSVKQFPLMSVTLILGIAYP